MAEAERRDAVAWRQKRIAEREAAQQDGETAGKQETLVQL